MPDVVVTVPKNFVFFDPVSRRDLKGLTAWIAEGDAEGESWSGTEWMFTLGGRPPRIRQGERVYIVCNGKLRGYAPLIRIDPFGQNGFALIRGGGAVAVTVDRVIRGFQGFRYRFWEYDQEIPFPDWRIA